MDKIKMYLTLMFSDYLCWLQHRARLQFETLFIGLVQGKLDTFMATMSQPTACVIQLLEELSDEKSMEENVKPVGVTVVKKLIKPKVDLGTSKAESKKDHEGEETATVARKVEIREVSPSVLKKTPLSPPVNGGGILVKALLVVVTPECLKIPSQISASTSASRAPLI